MPKLFKSHKGYDFRTKFKKLSQHQSSKLGPLEPVGDQNEYYADVCDKNYNFESSTSPTKWLSKQMLESEEHDTNLNTKLMHDNEDKTAHTNHNDQLSEHQIVGMDTNETSNQLAVKTNGTSNVSFNHSFMQT